LGFLRPRLQAARPDSVVGAFSVNARSEMDDKKCKEFGFSKGTDGYAKCRLQLENDRAISQTGTKINVH
jgi:hypothetical protein